MFDKHKGKKQAPARMNEPGLEPQSRASTSVSSPVSRAPAVIGPGILIKGDISGEEDLRIEGKVNGSIKLLNNEVSIGQSGEIMADVTAKVIRVAGRVMGDLTGKEKIILSKTGRVQGNIIAPRMLLEDGALFKGMIDMDPGEPEKPAAKPASKPAPATKPQAKPAPASATAPNPATKPAGSPGLVSESTDKAPDLALKRG